MRMPALFLLILLAFVFTACSGNNANPVIPDTKTNDEIAAENYEFTHQDASDVLYSVSAGNVTAYKALGAYRVVIDTASLTGEILPARNANAIGDTFDADLTQFLTLSPCYNCLKIDNITLLDNNRIIVEFAIKHPFPDLASRPDLHGFDVRGIVIANGNYNFPLTMVEQSDTETKKARANISLVQNPDGFTSHFDSLAADPNYFNPPLDYTANINPYKRFAVDPGTDPFDPFVPAGHNVFATGRDWEIVEYILNPESIGTPLDFVFVVDCAYGHSATFQNRDNPYYFLPEYNRKEAWKVDYLITSNDLQSGDSGSSAQIQVLVCDWQSSLPVDDNYPDTASLVGISAESNVALVTAEISNVSGLVDVISPTSGSGSPSEPYIFNLTLTNQEAVGAGDYYGVIAVRDDLQGQQGPIGIPENPNGFPFEGPEITDYSTYQVFQIRVYGSPPEIMPLMYRGDMQSGEAQEFHPVVNDPDGDDVTYLWEQISPAGPVGYFDSPDSMHSTWYAPSLYDVPVSGIDFNLKFTATDADGFASTDLNITVHENNSPPVCLGIDTDPFHGVIPIEPPDGTMDISIDAMDHDSDDLGFQWDMDWDLNPANFNVNNTGSAINGWSWAANGFYETGCRIFEDGRDYQKETFCSRTLVQEGHSENFYQIDDSSETDPEYFQQDIDVAISSDGRVVSHVVWNDVDDMKIYYTNNYSEHNTYGDVIEIDEAIGGDIVGYPQVAAFGDTVVVLWLEGDVDPNPNEQFISCKTSLDGGVSFSVEVNFNTILDPEMFMGLDVCSGGTSNVFYMTYQFLSNVGTYGINPLYTLDAGLTWSYPTGSTYPIRDNLGSAFIRNPTIAYSPDEDVIHVFWEDDWLSPDGYFYDYSTNHGESWNGNVDITEGDEPDFAAMSVADNGDAFFSWYGTSDLRFSRSFFNSGAPWYSSSIYVYGFPSIGSFNGLDIWNSPSGKTVVILANRYFMGYFNHYCYSFNYGEYFNIDFHDTDPDNTVLARIDGGFLSDPDRIEIASACINEQSTPPDRGHIDGDFFYLAERF